jgi:hypothetical protein
MTHARMLGVVLLVLAVGQVYLLEFSKQYSCLPLPVRFHA